MRFRSGKPTKLPRPPAPALYLTLLFSNAGIAAADRDWGSEGRAVAYHAATAQMQLQQKQQRNRETASPVVTTAERAPLPAEDTGLIADLGAALVPEAPEVPSVREDLERLARDVRADRGAAGQQNLAVLSSGHVEHTWHPRLLPTAPRATDLTEISPEAAGSFVEQETQKGLYPRTAALVEAAGGDLSATRADNAVAEALFEDAARTKLGDYLGPEDSASDGLGGGLFDSGAVPGSLLASSSTNIAMQQAQEAPGVADMPSLVGEEDLLQHRKGMAQALQAIMDVRGQAEEDATHAARSLASYSRALKKLRKPLREMADKAAGLQSNYRLLMQRQDAATLKPLRPLPVRTPKQQRADDER